MTTIVAGERCQCSGLWKWQLWKLTLEYKSSRLKQRSRCRVNSLVIQQGGKSLRMGLWGSCIRTQKQKSRTLAFWLQLPIPSIYSHKQAGKPKRRKARPTAKEPDAKWFASDEHRFIFANSCQSLTNIFHGQMDSANDIGSANSANVNSRLCSGKVNDTTTCSSCHNIMF